MMWKDEYARFVARRAGHQFILGQFSILEQRVLRQEMNAELLPSVDAWLFRHSIDSGHPFADYAIAMRDPRGRIDAE